MLAHASTRVLTVDDFFRAMATLVELPGGLHNARSLECGGYYIVAQFIQIKVPEELHLNLL